MKKWGSLVAAPLFFVFLVSLSGCDQLKTLMAPAAKSRKKVDVVQTTSAEPVNLMTAAEKFSFYRWLVKEMQEQILAHPITSNDQVNTWANVLTQRGSLEGVYHGLIYSTEYEGLEKGKAPPEALKFFADQMAALQMPEKPDLDPTLMLTSEEFSKEYADASTFTLKRVLGERVLAESAKRKGDEEGLANWYAHFAAKWSKMGFPLGAPQRSSTDEAYHRQWAKDNTLGLIQWELLNREHRILNHLGGMDVPVAAPAAAVAPAGAVAPAADPAVLPANSAPNPAGK